MYDEYEPRTVQNRSGEDIELTFNGTNAKASNSKKELVSGFTFEETEDGYYHLTHMNSCPPGEGIGTEIIKYVKEITDSYVTFSEDDGNKKEDGSHLTGNGPAFVNSLRKKGIIPKIENEFYDEEALY